MSLSAGQEIVCKRAAKHVKARLSGKAAMDRGGLDRELCIDINIPRLFEMDKFIEDCSKIFLSRYRQPLTINCKFRSSKVIERLQEQRSFLNW